MTAVPLLDHHTGGHCAPPSVLVSFFRRVLRMPWRKPAVPEVHFSASGAGPATLLDVPAGWTVSPSGSLIPPYPVASGRHASSARVACNSVQDRTIPRKRVPGSPPWYTDRFPVVRPEPYVPAYGVDRCQADVDEAQRLAGQWIA